MQHKHLFSSQKQFFNTTAKLGSHLLIQSKYVTSSSLFSFQKADLAIADLTITYEREQAVDFTMPFMNLGKKFFSY